MNAIPRGYIIYRGPSMINGEPIVVVANTAKSFNTKTGSIVQTYILVDNADSPITNSKTLADVAVCGSCRHRQGTGGACYVNLGRGPLQIWKGIQRGIYPHSLAGAMQASKDRLVRLGTYGDPAAVPAHVWKSLLKFAAAHTGYTHQWSTMPSDLIEPIMELCMASVDDEWERRVAKATGYRTFRVRTPGERVGTGEFICPAAEEAGKRRTCNTCRACSGGVDSSKADAVIIAHGILAKRMTQTDMFKEAA